MLYHNYLNSKRNNMKSRAEALPYLNTNVCSLPLNVYVDTRLKGNREPVVIYL